MKGGKRGKKGFRTHRVGRPHRTRTGGGKGEGVRTVVNGF